MRVKYFLFAGLSVMMLGACSNDDIEGAGEFGNKVEEGAEGYVSFRINLPQAAPARSESFNDGLASEYNVNDATLLLFAGTSEAEATFQSAYDLKTIGFAEDASSNQITSKATITQKITMPENLGTKSLYAMVVLNDNGLISIAEDGATTFDDTKLSDQKLEWFTNTVSKKTAAADFTGDGLFMTNAPLASVEGGDTKPENAKIQTLAPVDKSKIKRTAAEAGNDPAAVIYVERAVAKVTVTKATSLSTSGNSNVASYDIKNWILDNTNKKTYIVRNMNGVSNVAEAEAIAKWLGYSNATLQLADYRFVGSSPVGKDVINENQWYRTYFAVDPNFNQDVTGDNSDLATIGGQTFDEAKVTPLEIGDDKPGYCLENVFDVKYMKEKNTTRVIVAAQLNIKDNTETDGDFYTFNDNTNTIYAKDGVEKEVKRIALNWLEKNKSQWIEPKNPGTEYTIGESNLAVTVPTDKGGYIEKDITIKVTLPDEAQMKDEKTLEQLQDAMEAEVASKLTVGYYKGGISYYPVLVKHFGDTQTPWEYSQDKVGNSYPGENAAQNWLGRYGVLRNNWYQINVTGVKNIGSPEVPTVTDRYDDPTDSYMAVEINVLSWAVRTQDVEL